MSRTRCKDFKSLRSSGQLNACILLFCSELNVVESSVSFLGQVWKYIFGILYFHKDHPFLMFSLHPQGKIFRSLHSSGVSRTKNWTLVPRTVSSYDWHLGGKRHFRDNHNSSLLATMGSQKHQSYAMNRRFFPLKSWMIFLKVVALTHARVLFQQRKGYYITGGLNKVWWHRDWQTPTIQMYLTCACMCLNK